MTATLLHPDADQLAAYHRGTLDPGTAAAVDEHLADCDRCCEHLDRLPDDPFLDAVRAADAFACSDGSAPGLTAAFAAPAPGSGEAGPLPDALVDHPRYRVVGLCGRGGMGAVYRAEHRLMRRDVALKVIAPALMRRPAAVERFRREVRAAASLSHPNIVAAYDAERAGDLHFLVMEYVDGRDLAATVADRGPLAVGEACEYVRQAALGLAHAHALGMVHRDVKPHNLMVTPDGRVKILDFGLARFAREAAEVAGAADPAGDTASPHAELTHASTLLGTPDYAAPEQTRDSHAADVRADVYGLGCTLYFLLAGRPPFGGASVPEKIRGHAERDPQPVTEFRPDVPPGLADVLGRMMAKDPADRYQTAAAVAEELGRVAFAPPAGPWAAPAEPAADPRKPRFRRGVLVAAGLLGVAAAVAAGFIIKVTGPDGKSTEVEVPDGSKVTVGADGRVAVVVPPAGTGVKPPTAAALPPPPVGTTVDLLPLVVPAQDAVAGDWVWRRGDLVGPPHGGSAVIRFPYRPGDEYDYEVDVTRTDGETGVGLVVPRGGRSIKWLVGHRGPNHGFTRADLDASLSPGAPIVTGRRYRLRVEVRRDRVTGFIDGAKASEVTGKGAELKVDDASRLRDGRHVGIATGGGLVTLHRVRVTEVTGAGTITRPTNLPSADLEAERAAAMWIVGQGGAVRVELAGGQTRTSVGGRGAGLPDEPFVVRGVDFREVHGAKLDAPALATRLRGLAGVRDLSVHGVGAADALVAALAAAPAVSVTTLDLTRSGLTDIGLAAAAKLPAVQSLVVKGTHVTDAGLAALRRDPPALARLYLTGTKVTAAGVQALAAARPPVRITWDGGAVGPAVEKEGGAAQPAGRTVDLLALVLPARDVVSAEWVWKRGDLVGPGEPGAAGVQFPYRPGEEYDFEVDVTRKSGGTSVGLVVPRGGRLINWLVGHRGPNHGFIRADLDASLSPGAPIVTGRRYRLRVEVRRDRVTGYIDGAKASEVKGDEADLAEVTKPWDGRHVGIATGGGLVTLHRVRVTEVTGAGTITRPATLPVSDLEAERAAAGWVLDNGGAVTVEPSGGQPVRGVGPGRGARLPDEPFVVRGVEFGEADGAKLDAAALAGHLRRLAGVSDLGVRGVGAADDLVAALAAASCPVTALDLTRSGLTDDGLANVAKLPAVRSLVVKGTRVTDPGLAALHRAPPALARLDLTGAKVTAAGVKALAAARPLVRITWDGGAVGPPPEKDGGAGRPPVRAVVVEERPDHKAGAGVVATVLVQITDDGGQHSFKRGGGRAYLEITRETKITRRAGQKTEPAGPGDLKKGVTVEFASSGVANSEPAIISATAVVVVEPAK